MKKIVLVLVATCLSLSFVPLQAAAQTNSPSAPTEATKPVDPAESAEAKTLLLRLDEIKAMDMKKIEASEKKDLRKEVRSIKHELRTIGGGVYLSAGAVILLVILLIVLL